MLRSAFSRQASSVSISRRDSTMSSSSISSSIADTDAPFVACLVHICVERLQSVPREPPDLHLVLRLQGDSKAMYISQKLETNETDTDVGDKVTIAVEDIGRSLTAEVVAKNKWRKDNVVDRGSLELSQCKLFKWQELVLQLERVAIVLSIQIHPITAQQKEEFTKRWGNGGRVEFAKTNGYASGSDSSIINIVLIKGFGIGDTFDPPDASVKFKLGSEKYKSKVVAKSCDPEWGESFEMKLPKNVDVLEIQVVCRRQKVVLSTGEVNLSGLPRDRAIRQEVHLYPHSSLSIIVSVPDGGSTTSSVLANVAPNYDSRFKLLRTFTNMSDVGELIVKVIRAENVEAKDMNGKSDPFAILRMGNLRVRTHTHYATLNPEWNRLYVLPVEDIHTCLDVTLFDEDNTGKADFLGRIAIHLLSIDGWERRWFTLKDRKLLKTTRGRVLLELRLQYNVIRAVVRTINPREKEYLAVTPKLKPSVLKSSVNEIRRYGAPFKPFAQKMDNVMRWNRPIVTIVCLIVYVLVVLHIEVYHLPLLLILFILRSSYSAQHSTSSHSPTPPPTPSAPETNTSILSITDTLLEVQEILLTLTHVLQRLRNTTNMTSPWLTKLALFALTAATVLLYLVPVRYLLLAWGINKFTKRLRKPANYVDNNELMDFLSRVPSDRQLREFEEPVPELPGG